MRQLRARDIAWHKVEGEIICLDLATSRYLSINAVGAALWERLLVGANDSELVAELEKTFDVSHKRAESDVASLADLQRRGLLAAE